MACEAMECLSEFAFGGYTLPILCVKCASEGVHWEMTSCGVIHTLIEYSSSGTVCEGNGAVTEVSVCTGALVDVACNVADGSTE